MRPIWVVIAFRRGAEEQGSLSHCFVRRLDSRFLAEMLSDSESGGDDQNVQLTINEHYAQAYKAKKEREELQKRS
jgi:hypothetical protein